MNEIAEVASVGGVVRSEGSKRHVPVDRTGEDERIEPLRCSASVSPVHH